jgi:hypothetical protein
VPPEPDDPPLPVAPLAPLVPLAPEVPLEPPFSPPSSSLHPSSPIPAATAAAARPRFQKLFSAELHDVTCFLDTPVVTRETWSFHESLRAASPSLRRFLVTRATINDFALPSLHESRFDDASRTLDERMTHDCHRA